MDGYGEELAEGEGFEPPVPFQAQRFSRPPVSTAHPSLRGCRALSIVKPKGEDFRRGCRELPVRRNSAGAVRGARGSLQFARGNAICQARNQSKSIKITANPM